MNHEHEPWETPTAGATGTPPPPPPPPPTTRPRRRGAPIIIAVVVVVGLLAGAIAFAATRGPSGPPGAPTGVRLTAATCTPPRCHAISSTVTIDWTAPSTGSAVTGYSIVRDGSALGARVSATTLRYEDGTASFGSTYAYRVVAHSDHGDSPASSAATVKVPLPPVAAAQLVGTYHVKLTLRSATELGKVEGIKDPAPGDTAKETWTFTVACSPNSGPCPAAWFSQEPLLRPRGLAYDGTIRGRPALCGIGGSATRVPSFVTFRLKVTRASGSAAWDVSAFVGTYTISFTCPGGAASRGLFKVTGRSYAGR